MAYFEAIRNLISPAKKEGSGYFKTPSRLPPRLDRGRMSPKQRYDDWLKRSQTPQTPAKKVKASEGLGVKESKITKSIASPKSERKSGTSAKSLNKFLNLLPSIIYKQHDRQGVEHDEQPNTDTKDTIDQLDDELEGTTIVKDETPELSPKLQDKFDSDTTLIGNEEEKSSVEKAKKVSNADTDAFTYSGWGPDEIWLFKKIKMCGLEPLFHHSWSVDFDEFGDQLFTTDDSKVFIKAENGRDFHACRELEGLLSIGRNVRDLLVAKKSPEETIRKHLETYHRWSMADAGLQNIQHIPVISIATATPNESTASVLNRLNHQLHTEAEKYYSLWIDEDATNDIELCYFHDLPTLYGVLITRSVVAILSHDTIHPGEAARFLARCDFRNEDHDGWIALALSVLFIKARNYLMELEEQGELGPEIEHVTDDLDT